MTIPTLSYRAKRVYLPISPNSAVENCGKIFSTIHVTRVNISELGVKNRGRKCVKIVQKNLWI